MCDQQDRLGLCPLHHPAFCGELSRRSFLELVAVAGAALNAAGRTVVAGFHVLQVYGDHVRKLRDFCQLYRIEAVHSWDPRISFDFEPNCA